MSALYAIVCNTCGAAASYQSRKSIAHCRRVSHDRGWTNPAPGQDYCMTCSAARAARAKKENPDGYL